MTSKIVRIVSLKENPLCIVHVAVPELFVPAFLAEGPATIEDTQSEPYMNSYHAGHSDYVAADGKTIPGAFVYERDGTIIGGKSFSKFLILEKKSPELEDLRLITDILPGATIEGDQIKYDGPTVMVVENAAPLASYKFDDEEAGSNPQAPHAPGH